MTTVPSRPAAAAAVALAAVLGVAACGAGGQTSGSPAPGASASATLTPAASTSASSGSSTPARSTSGPGASATRTSPSASSGSPVSGRSGSTGTGRSKQAAKERKQAERHRQHVQARKRLIAACLEDADTLKAAVKRYNAAVASGSGDRLSAAGRTLRKAANTVHHNAGRAKNHRLSTLSKKVVHDLGVMAALIDQGEDVSGAALTADSRKLRAYCSSRL